METRKGTLRSNGGSKSPSSNSNSHVNTVVLPMLTVPPTNSEKRNVVWTTPRSPTDEIGSVSSPRRRSFRSVHDTDEASGSKGAELRTGDDGNALASGGAANIVHAGHEKHADTVVSNVPAREPFHLESLHQASTIDSSEYDHSRIQTPLRPVSTSPNKIAQFDAERRLLYSRDIERTTEPMTLERQLKIAERRIANRDEKLSALLKDKLQWQQHVKELREQVAEEKRKHADVVYQRETIQQETTAQYEAMALSLRSTEEENDRLKAELQDIKTQLAVQTRKTAEMTRQVEKDREKRSVCVVEARNKFGSWKDSEATALQTQQDQTLMHVRTEYELHIARHEEEKQNLREKVHDLEVSLRLLQKDRTLSPLELTLRKAAILASSDHVPGTNEVEWIEKNARINELEALLKHAHEVQKQESLIKTSERTISRLMQEREVIALDRLASSPAVGMERNQEVDSSTEKTVMDTSATIPLVPVAPPPKQSLPQGTIAVSSPARTKTSCGAAIPSTSSPRAQMYPIKSTSAAASMSSGVKDVPSIAVEREEIVEREVKVDADEVMSETKVEMGKSQDLVAQEEKKESITHKEDSDPHHITHHENPNTNIPTNEEAYEMRLTTTPPGSTLLIAEVPTSSPKKTTSVLKAATSSVVPSFITNVEVAAVEHIIATGFVSVDQQDSVESDNTAEIPVVESKEAEGPSAAVDSIVDESPMAAYMVSDMSAEFASTTTFAGQSEVPLTQEQLSSGTIDSESSGLSGRAIHTEELTTVATTVPSDQSSVAAHTAPADQNQEQATVSETQVPGAQINLPDPVSNEDEKEPVTASKRSPAQVPLPLTRMDDGVPIPTQSFVGLDEAEVPSVDMTVIADTVHAVTEGIVEKGECVAEDIRAPQDDRIVDGADNVTLAPSVVQDEDAVEVEEITTRRLAVSRYYMAIESHAVAVVVSKVLVNAAIAAAAAQMESKTRTTHDRVFSLRPAEAQMSMSTVEEGQSMSNRRESNNLGNSTLMAYDVKHLYRQPCEMLDENILSVNPLATHLLNEKLKEHHHHEDSKEHKSGMNTAEGLSKPSHLVTKKKRMENDIRRRTMLARCVPAFNYEQVLIKFQWSDFVIATPVRNLSTSTQLDILKANGVSVSDIHKVPNTTESTIPTPSSGIESGRNSMLLDRTDSKTTLAVSPIQKMKLIVKKGVKLPCSTYVIISVFTRPLEDGNENIRIQIYDSERVEEFQYDFDEDHLREYVEHWTGSDEDIRHLFSRLEFRSEQDSIYIKMPEKIRRDGWEAAEAARAAAVQAAATTSGQHEVAAAPTALVQMLETISLNQPVEFPPEPQYRLTSYNAPMTAQQQSSPRRVSPTTPAISRIIETQEDDGNS